MNNKRRDFCTERDVLFVSCVAEEQTDDVMASLVEDRVTEEQTDDVMASFVEDRVTEEQTDDVMAKAVAESHTTHQLRRIAFKVHNKRLDNILHHNGIERIVIPADGDCFFSAAALHLIQHDRLSLREALCFHMEHRMEDYLGFFLSKWDR